MGLETAETNRIRRGVAWCYGNDSVHNQTLPRARRPLVGVSFFNPGIKTPCLNNVYIEVVNMSFIIQGSQLTKIHEMTITQ